MDEERSQEKPAPSLSETLSAIRAGDLDVKWMARLSDLTRDDARAVVDDWRSFPEELRGQIVRRIEGLTEERIDLNFSRLLRIALDDLSPVVRQLAIGALWEDDSQIMMDWLRRTLREDSSPDVRAAAAAALTRFADMAATGSLDEATANELHDELLRAAGVEEPSYTARRRATEALGPFADRPEVERTIAAAYDSGDHGLQCSALYAMGLSLDAQWLPTIVSELDSEEAELRFEAARAAGLIASADALPALLRAARDEDAEVRHAAIASIGQIGGRGAVRALERLAEEAGEADMELIDAAMDEVNTLLEPFQTAP